jgi:outer membrane receptor for ferrienterochelin and colicins
VNFYRILNMIVVVAIVSASGFSASAHGKPENTEQAIDEEMKWLRAETAVFTEIATKTRMDADLAPGMVTVLKGKDLESKGIRTVFEALSLVPGVMTSMNSVGEEHVLVRGIGGGFFSGNMKLMLDGVMLNDTLSASGFALYQIPIAQIEKIEIIRGPGSVIYGDYAYAGVIDITTRKSGNQVYARYSDDDAAYGGGTSLSYALPEKDFNISLNLSGRNSDGADVRTGKDRLYEPFAGFDLSSFSQAPGKTNEARKDRFASLALKYKDFSLSGQYILNGKGDHFGPIHVLGPPEERIEISHEHQSLEARQVLNFSDEFKADIKVGLREYEYEMDYVSGLPPVSVLGFPSGSVLSGTYSEKEGYGGAELICTALRKHTILLGTKYSDLSMKDVTASTTLPESEGQMVELTGDELWLVKDKTRKVFSAYLQDMYNVTENIALTGGLRYDNYNDMGNYLTPRISAVWKLAEHHILKAQYSESVRPPTFTELYSKGTSFIEGNPNLDSEHIRSYEAEYIYRKPGISTRMTLFCSELKDKILYPDDADTFSGANIRYRNAGSTLKTKGIEVEFGQELRKDLQAGINLSYSDTDDEDGKPIAGAADWLTNASLTYKPAQDYVFTLQYHYTGDRHRIPDDPREDLKGFHTVHLTANIFNLFMKGLILRAGVKNLFDADIIYPAPVFKDETGTIGYYYKDDFPRPGREWWASVSYEF